VFIKGVFWSSEVLSLLKAGRGQGGGPQNLPTKKVVLPGLRINEGDNDIFRTP